MTVNAGAALEYATNREVLKLILGLLATVVLCVTGVVLALAPFTLPRAAATFLGVVVAITGLLVGSLAGVALVYKATADGMVHAATSKIDHD